MKKLALISFFLLNLFLYSCNSSNKSEEVASYTYEEKKTEMNDELKAKIPDWVEEGKVCYGLVIQVTNEDKPIKGKPVKAKVVQIDESSVKMKALETVVLDETIDCNLKGITKGQIWDEKDGDLYLTFDDAVEMLKKMDIYRAK